MAYGFSAKNANNETVINDVNPVLVQKRSGTHSRYGTLNGISQFRDNGGMQPIGQEVPVVKVPVGSFIMRAEGWFNNAPSGDYSSNMNPLDYVVFGPRNLMPAPTGYGAAVYDASGACMWDSASITARLIGAGSIPAAQIVNAAFSINVDSTANAIFIQGGDLIIWNNTADRRGMRATRISTTQWNFSIQPFGFGGSGGTTTFKKDFFYMFAQID